MFVYCCVFHLCSCYVRADTKSTARWWVRTHERWTGSRSWTGLVGIESHLLMIDWKIVIALVKADWVTAELTDLLSSMSDTDTTAHSVFFLLSDHYGTVPLINAGIFARWMSFLSTQPITSNTERSDRSFCNNCFVWLMLSAGIGRLCSSLHCP